MLKRIGRTLVMLTLLLAPSAIAPPSHAGLSVSVAKQDCIVYVTKTGHKYHRAGCRYLRRSAIATSRAKAVAKGMTPCSVCGGSDCE